MNKKILIVMSHGKESGPAGTKLQALARVAEKMKATALTVDYRGIDDPDERVKHLLARPLPPHDILILAGSSMGGYVSLVASEQLKPQGLFLMAPALGKAGYQVENPVPHAAHLSIVQGWGDTVTLPQQAIEFAQNHGAELLMVDDEHRLSESVPAIQAQFERLVRRASGARLAKLERPRAASPSRLESGVLERLAGKALFYPCAGEDYRVPIETFAPYITDFYFVDKGYFCPGDQDARYTNFGCRAEAFIPCLQLHPDYALVACDIEGPSTARPRRRYEDNEDYSPFSPWAVAVGQRTETYLHHPSGQTIRLHFRRDDGVTALKALAESMRLGVFFYRGDSMGEGGSGVMWLQRTLIHEVLQHLDDGGLYVTDGSQHHGMGWKQDEGVAYEYENLWQHSNTPAERFQADALSEFTDTQGIRFKCVGHTGVRYGLTLA